MKKLLFLATLLIATLTGLHAQQHATVRLNAQNQHQHITGFGGFVCSPQFTYNHMSDTEIKRVWGTASSSLGCNIMRLYIPIGRNAWGQSLQTAKLAKQLGLIVFASPWGQPAEWKTNGTSNAKNSDGTTGKLKRENWADYAQYLDDYVKYLRQNGVELDAISIQNEPDWAATYAGCLWSAQEIAEFVKTYGRQISCKIMAPETLAVSDGYANELNKSDVVDCFDIYGGHQYGGIQSAYKNLGKKGKEVWMTEYLINWNENQSQTRNFNFDTDFFDFFRAINVCMLGDFNAWIHYSAKRYYGMIGDGTNGSTSGSVTKRGWIMAHFARYVKGMTRIDATFTGGQLEGSGYISATGDTVVAVMANTGDDDVALTLDMPFYTTTGKFYNTTKTRNMGTTTIALDEETCRPEVLVAAKSVATAVFVRSRDRQPSQMKGSMTHFNRLDDMERTKSTFGTAYKLSGKSKTFDHSNPLISTRTTAGYGFLQLNDRYSELVMEVKSVSSTMNYSSALTTLYYVNDKGEASSHDYGDIDLSRRQNFSLVFDLSPRTLHDGCRGIISLTNNNYTSKLTMVFGDVYLSNGGHYAATLSGAYVADDSYVFDYTTDPACTSIDLTSVSSLPDALPWLQSTNRIAYLPEGSMTASIPNVVIGTECNRLQLTADGGDFRPSQAFTTSDASLTCTIEGMRLLMLPFSASVPEGSSVWSLATDGTLQSLTDIPAHQPVLVIGNGLLTFCGNDTVSYAISDLDSHLRGAYTSIPLYAGDYVLGQVNSQWGLLRLETDGILPPFSAYARLTTTEAFIPINLSQTGISQLSSDIKPGTPHQIFDVQGRRLSTVGSHQRGIVIVRTADGRVHKTFIR